MLKQGSNRTVCIMLKINLFAGFLCMRYGDLLLKGEAKDLYQGILSQPNQPLKLKLQVGIFCSCCFCSCRARL